MARGAILLGSWNRRLNTPRVAIIDYGLGNLFSLARACEHVGMAPTVTSDPKQMAIADAIILPGVGAFGDAMKSLRSLDLVQVLRDFASNGKPLVGICLGMQLLLSESDEFGTHQGLGIIEGTVRSFHSKNGLQTRESLGRVAKIPEVGWNRVYTPADREAPANSWAASGVFAGLSNGFFMYFVHSYIAKPADPNIVIGRSNYGGVEYCSALQAGNVTGFQFHPERSGEAGLQIYHNIASSLPQN